MASRALPATLSDVTSWAPTSEDLALLHLLLEEDQGHLFAGFRPGEDFPQKRAFLAQVRALQSGYPGGLKAYLSNARSLLKSSAGGDNPFVGMTPEVPEGRFLEYASPEFIEAEEVGLAAFKDCAFVLVAGGLGERLGYTGIKLSLPVQVATDSCYLEVYIQQILAMQAASNALNGGSASVVPLAIMTSDDTDAATRELLDKHANFGAAPGQVTIMKQEKVAALVDNDAHMTLLDGDAYTIDTKPHGHGDVHQLLASTGLASKWAAEGRKYIVFFQDTQALCFTVSIAAIGVSEQSGYDMNSCCVPRKAKDAVGAITRLVRGDGTSLTVNVEYNQLEPLFKATGHPEGDVNDPATGFSPYPGNINQLILRVGPYAEVLKRTGGLVPEFVNPKYADAAKNKFKKPTRLECMMQEHPKVMPPESRVGFTTFPDWTYSPVKNSVDEARAKIAVGAPGRSAAEGELEYYGAGCRLLAAAGVRLDAFGTLSVFGFTLARPPIVVFHPSFAVSFKNAKSKFTSPEHVRISARSSLVLEGPGISVGALELDGALVIKAAPGASVIIKHLKVQNAGWELVPLAEGEEAPPALRIRGFKVVKHTERTLEFPKPGNYVVDEA